MKSMTPILLLVASNIFMTFAWYGHLKHKTTALWIVILVSWGIAFFEYCLQVPANRLGSDVYTAPQLKIIQEVITLVVFIIFSATFLKQNLRPNEWIAMGLVLVAAVVANWPSASAQASSAPQGTMEKVTSSMTSLGPEIVSTTWRAQGDPSPERAVAGDVEGKGNVVAIEATGGKVTSRDAGSESTGRLEGKVDGKADGTVDGAVEGNGPLKADDKSH